MMEAVRAELERINPATPPQELTEPVELEIAPHVHIHEVDVATESLGRLTRARHWVQLQVIESAPTVGTFIEAQAACSCAAGCARCGGGTFLLGVWGAAKAWAGRRFSRTASEEDQPG